MTTVDIANTQTFEDYDFPFIGAIDGGGEERTFTPRSGRTIEGRYILVEEIGAGGMGLVYKAIDSLKHLNVAVKFLQRSAACDRVSRERFMREARIASSFRHQNAVRVLDTKAGDDYAFLVMDLLEGRTLSDVLKAGRLPVDRALGIALQVADFLSAAHDASIVHRDLKPSNIFIERLGASVDAVRVVDFGLAFVEGDYSNGRVTETGCVLGTPAYLAPEQAKGTPVGTRADIYSLGCVLYRMLTGKAVFSGTALHVIMQHMHMKPAPLSCASPGAEISPDIEALVMRMLHKQPEDRPPAEHVLDVLSREIGEW